MKREFVINRHGKDYVLYAGLLDAAHQRGLKAIKTQLLQAPSAQNGNVAICFAEVTTEQGTFTGLGDADPGNVNRAMATALIRLAETRAKARALRDAVNVGMVAIEELAESAPDSLLADEAPEPLAARVPAPPPVQGAGPARIVSLPSVRQAIRDTAGALAAEAAAGPAAATLGTPAPAARAAAAARMGAKASPEGPPPPATPTQLETIAKLARSIGREVPTHDLTRAAASELITRLSEERYGARRGS